MPHLGESLPFCGPGTSHALPLSHSPPQNLLYLLKSKTPPTLFSAGKLPPWNARGFFAPKIKNMEVFFQ